MKTLTETLFLVLCIITGYVSEAQILSKISVDGKNLVNEKGEIIRFKGVSFSDPDKLENDGQWNKRYFQEAKNWGCNTVRFAVHPTALNKHGGQLLKN